MAEERSSASALVLGEACCRPRRLEPSFLAYLVFRDINCSAVSPFRWTRAKGGSKATRFRRWRRQNPGQMPLQKALEFFNDPGQYGNLKPVRVHPFKRVKLGPVRVPRHQGSKLLSQGGAPRCSAYSLHEDGTFDTRPVPRLICARAYRNEEGTRGETFDPAGDLSAVTVTSGGEAGADRLRGAG
jgi:hypothetical protein